MFLTQNMLNHELDGVDHSNFNEIILTVLDIYPKFYTCFSRSYCDLRSVSNIKKKRICHLVFVGEIKETCRILSELTIIITFNALWLAIVELMRAFDDKWTINQGRPDVLYFFEEETPYVCFLLPRSNVSVVNLFRFVIFSAPFITSSVCLSIPLCPTCLRTYPYACLSVCPFNSNFDCLPNLFFHLCFQS